MAMNETVVDENKKLWKQQWNNGEDIKIFTSKTRNIVIMVF